MTRTIEVAGIQTGPGDESTAANVDRGLRLLDGVAANKQLDLVVFDELFNTRFFAVDRLERFDHYFETVPGPTVNALADAARRYRTNIVAGIGERASSGSYYNSAVVIDRGGEVVGIYRKTHVPLMAAPEDRATYERSYFRPGDELPVFDLDCAKLGVLICYDRHFPEAWRTLATRGAEIVAVPTGARSWNRSWRSGIWEALLRTMAYVNGVFVVGVNRAGVEEHTTYTGDSMIVSPTGGLIISRADEGAIDCTITATLDLEELVRCRETIPFRRDLRSEIYARG
jgi:N-carbamoylputrescine amidase